jgi:hypothetical protein
MDMPKLTPGHQALSILVGNWIGEESLKPSPWDPVGGPAVGRVHNRPALGGFAVIQDYEQERDGVVSFLGHAVFLWDAKANVIVMHWFDSWGMAPVAYSGTLAGKILVLQGPSGGGFGKAIWDFSRPGIYDYTLAVSPDGKQWSVFQDGRYVKQEG